MTRLIIKQGETFHILVHVVVKKNDGSIILNLVRKGTSEFGWRSNSSTTATELIPFSTPLPKTKKISIHASGRVNYDTYPTKRVNYIPVLLDLEAPESIVCYLIPSVSSLDTVPELKGDDTVIEIQSEFYAGALGFEFVAIPSSLEHIPGEIWRVIVESQYGLACTVSTDISPVPEGIPPEAFTQLFPSSRLERQAAAEDETYLRFQNLIRRNSIRENLGPDGIPEEMHVQVIEEVIKRGIPIKGPNGEGVWEIIFTVPMRVRPKLQVVFADSRYRSEVVDIIDARLEKVRVRFKVYDEKTRGYVKHSVEMIEAILDAEL